MIYLDAASTTSVHPEVARVYSQLIETSYANADALHQMGRDVARLQESARQRIAQMLAIKPEEVIFTASASEANSLAIIGYCLANRQRGNHVLMSVLEHPSVLNCAHFLETVGFEVEFLQVDGKGYVCDLAQKMRKDTILVSIQHVNNEVGIIQDVAKLSAIIHQHPTCVFHCDCVQSFGRLPVNFHLFDLASLSGHKIHGIKGSALLYKKDKIQLMPLIQGGQQEYGLRGGTSNAPANICLAKTIRLALDHQKVDQAASLKAYLVKQISQLKGVTIYSHEGCVPHIVNLGFDCLTSEVLLNALDQKGFCVSAKSTCSSHSKQASQVLLAMGKSEKEATQMIRVSFDDQLSYQEIDQFVQACKECIDQYGVNL